jgi:hypothetical protein
VSVDVLSLVWKSNIGPANKRLVLLALADNANDGGFCHPGLAYLHGKTGVGRSTTIRILNELEADGIIQRRDRRRSNGSRRSNAYRISLPALVARSRIVSDGEKSDLAKLFEEPQVEDMVPERDHAGDDELDGDTERPADQRESDDPQVGDMVPERDYADGPETSTSEGPSPRSDAWSRSGTTPVPERDPLNRHRNRHSEPSTSSSAAPPRGEPHRADVEQLCTRLRDRMIGNGCKPPTITDGWRKAARLLLDKDGRELDKALNLLDWVAKDDFWRTNIMSMPTFRTRYDQLRLKALAEHAKAAGTQQRSRTAIAVESVDAAFAAYERQQAAEQRAALHGHSPRAVSA